MPAGFTFIDGIVLVAFPAAMAFAAASDMLTMRISNLVSIVLVAGFVVLAPLSGFDLALIGNHVGVAALVLIAGFICFSLGWMGGADAKIAAAIALWFGWQHTLEFLIVAALFGGALTLIIMLVRLVPLPAHVENVGWIRRLHNAANGVPYGIALAAGALFVYPETVWMASVVG